MASSRSAPPVSSTPSSWPVAPGIAGSPSVAFVGHVRAHGVSHERHSGYVQELINLGLPAPKSMTVDFGEWPHDLEGVYLHGAALMAMVELGATAVVACSDLAEVGAMKMLKGGACRYPVTYQSSASMTLSCPGRMSQL